MEFKESDFFSNLKNNENIFDLNLDDYNNYKISYKYFYNDEIKEKVYKFYKNDFMFFNKYGIDYKQLGI